MTDHITIDNAFKLAEEKINENQIDQAQEIFRRILEKLPDNIQAKDGLWFIEKINTSYCSQSGQDKYIFENFFKNKTNGFFVDIGAHDGISASNTHFFEKNLNWNGICIEPSPNQFELLKKNRNCVCLKLAVSNFSGEAEFLNIEKGYHMMSGLTESLNPAHLKKFEEHPQNNLSKIKVKVETLENIFLKNNINHVDFCSIDVEGNEMKIIQDFDFNKYKIDILSLENNTNQNLYEEKMKSSGYKKFAKIGVDEIYVRKDFLN